MNPTDLPPARPATAASPPRSRSRWKWVATLVFLLGAAALYFLYPPKQQAAATGGPGSGRGGRFGGAGPTPVSIAAITQGELHVYLSALGSVTALHTVTVKTRVDGALQAVRFSEGQLIQAGEPVAEIDPRPFQAALDQAEGQLARDTALLANARRDFERYQNARDAVTQQQLDTAQAAVGQYEGTVRTDQGLVDNDRLQLSYCHITAPITGRVGLRMVDPGNLVHASDPGLVVIAQEEPIAVVFSIPEDNLPVIRKELADGQELPVEAYDRALAKRLATGHLAALDNQIDLATGTVRLKAEFANADHGLFPNQFVNVRMLTEVEHDVLLVPNSAIQINGPARFVFVVKPDSSVERRTVTPGRTEGEQTVVTDGLALGDQVVTEGLDRLQNGTKVITRTPVPEKPANGPDKNGKEPNGEHRKKRQKSS